MNESLVKYLAGLLDADGSLSFRFRCDDNKPHRLYLGLILVLSSSKAVDQRGFVSSLPGLTGFGGFSTYGEDKKFYRWETGKTSHLEMLLPRLIKHMVIKARHWQWMLDTWREQRGNPHSAEECDELRKASKASRASRVGPLKPKNHPTWAWLAGYLDGDGWYRLFDLKRKSGVWHASVGAVSHVNDMEVLRFIQKAFGGNIRNHGQSKDCFVWHRGLGAAHRSFALRFLPNLTKHARLKKHKIDQMIHYHQQRLSAPSPTG